VAGGSPPKNGALDLFNSPCAVLKRDAKSCSRKGTGVGISISKEKIYVFEGEGDLGPFFKQQHITNRSLFLLFFYIFGAFRKHEQSSH